jgi:hypothetical protein
MLVAWQTAYYAFEEGMLTIYRSDHVVWAPSLANMAQERRVSGNVCEMIVEMSWWTLSKSGKRPRGRRDVSARCSHTFSERHRVLSAMSLIV